MMDSVVTLVALVIEVLHYYNLLLLQLKVFSWLEDIYSSPMIIEFSEWHHSFTLVIYLII